MYTKVFELRVPAPVGRVWEFYRSGSSLEKLSPPGSHVRMATPDAKVEEGALHEIRMRKFGLPIKWLARISQVTPPYGFTDQAEKSPFAFWRHRHDFIPDGEGTLIREILVYEMPFGKLGKAVHKLRVEKDIEALFAYRQEVMKKEFGGDG